MPFITFKSIAEVAKAYQITCLEAEFVQPLPLAVNDYFRAELAFVQREVVYNGSEAAICENLIYPILKEVWKPFSGALSLWSHPSLSFDDVLCGIPDYLVARRSPLGKIVLDQPYLIVVEAKKDNFEQGWAQCLAGMLAAEKLNADPEQVIYGVVSNGNTWAFGKLHANSFIQHPRLWTVFDLEELMAALHYLLVQCKEQASAQPCPA